MPIGEIFNIKLPVKLKSLNGSFIILSLLFHFILFI